MENTYKVNEEAVKKIAERVYDNGSTVINRNDLEEMFPELAESEDERIRKALINGFNKLDKSAVWYNGITNGQILAWLEKQGEHANFRNKIQIGDKVTRNRDGILVNLSQLNRVAKNEKQGEQKPTIEMKSAEESLGIDSETYNKIVDECVYGEQKTAGKVEPKFRVGDKIRRKTPRRYDKDMQVARIESDYYLCNHLGKFSSEPISFSEESNYELVEHKPAEWSEPKFKIGDWVVYDGWTCQITYVKKDGYCNDHNGFIPKDREDDMRLWTIQDAKEGDMLACPNDAGDRDVVFIFKNINSDEGWVFCFCASDANGCFCTNNDYVGNSNSTNISPATKEQRDTLMKVMADAGYRWNKEELKLEKI